VLLSSFASLVENLYLLLQSLRKSDPLSTL